MKSAGQEVCAICLEPRGECEGWLLLTENRWTDRVKILAWNDILAAQPGVHAACGAEHAQQLVIHWMAMGTLDYPFARSYSRGKGSIRKSGIAEPCAAEPDSKGVRVFGELAVHRESLERVLSESPQSLISMMTALITALGGHTSTNQKKEKENEAVCVLT